MSETTAGIGATSSSSSSAANNPSAGTTTTYYYNGEEEEEEKEPNELTYLAAAAAFGGRRNHDVSRYRDEGLSCSLTPGKNKNKNSFSNILSLVVMITLLLGVVFAFAHQTRRMAMPPLSHDDLEKSESSLLLADKKMQVPFPFFQKKNSTITSSSGHHHKKKKKRAEQRGKKHQKEEQEDKKQEQVQARHQVHVHKEDHIGTKDQQERDGKNQTSLVVVKEQQEQADPKFQKRDHAKSDKRSSSRKHHKKEKDKNRGDSKYPQGNMACLEDEKYSSHTAKTAYEMPFAALFKDTRGEKKFEASSVFNLNGTYYAVCDNSWAISKFDYALTPFSDKNVMIGEPNREAEDSGYEAIFVVKDTVYVVRESVKHHGTGNNSTTGISSSLSSSMDGNVTASTTNITYHATIEELEIKGNDYEIKDQCSCEFEFEGDSKGFEGAFGLEGIDGELYVIGLCEGNYCSESKKDDKGHGKIALMTKNSNNNNNNNNNNTTMDPLSSTPSCLWETIKVIDIPSTAFFTDYSDISIRPNGKVAITTQEDSAVWIGQLLGIQEGKLQDPDNLSFDENVHEVYYFPKSDTCKTIYCNVEGITFINDDMLMAVSDQMKKGGKQPYWCLEKDQSIHAFVLP